MAIPRLLVVDDDEDMRQMMTQFLRKHGFIALSCDSHQAIHEQMKNNRIDLILLDVMLGDENGVDICAALRDQHDVPIILVSALSADHQRMAGYEVGADDYIAKPFNPDLLLARVRAVLQRAKRSASLSYRRHVASFRFAGWTLDAKRNEITAPDGVQIALSTREMTLLKVLLANPHIPLTREEIAASLDVVGDNSAEGSGRAIDVLVGRLRAKIEDNPKAPKILKTQRGIGYVFSVDVVVDGT